MSRRFRRRGRKKKKSLGNLRVSGPPKALVRFRYPAPPKPVRAIKRPKAVEFVPQVRNVDRSGRPLLRRPGPMGPMLRRAMRGKLHRAPLARRRRLLRSPPSSMALVQAARSRAFSEPLRRRMVCTQRAVRRQVLAAKRKLGYGGHKRYRKTANSQVRCK